MIEVAYAQSFLDQLMGSRGERDERGNDSNRQMEGLWPSGLRAHPMYLIHIISLKKVGKFLELEKVTILNRVVD